MTTLDRQEELLGLLTGDPDVFFSSYWERTPLHRPGALPGTSPFRVTLDEVRSALSNPLLRAPFFLMMRDGQPVPLARITRTMTVGVEEVQDLISVDGVLSELASGSTLTLREAATQIPSLAQPRARLAAELGGANILSFLFVTPGSSQGFGWHRDAQEVFIVQSLGRKRFDLVPARQVVGGRGRVPDSEPPFDESAIVSFDLDEGDVLYIPSGCPHRAKSLNPTGSIHLSLNIQKMEWFRVVSHALRSAMNSLPKYAPLEPSPAAAKEWLTELAAAAAALVDNVSTSHVSTENANTNAAVVGDTLRGLFGGPPEVDSSSRPS